VNPESPLSRHRSAILDSWIRRTLEGYPEPAAARLLKVKDPFRNPVGATLRTGLEAILDGLLEGAAPGDLSGRLEEIVRVRAVQDLEPSRAIGFLFDLKAILRERDPESAPALDTAIDRIALLAFDRFVACREKIYDIRVSEIRNQTHRALQQAGILGHDPVPPRSGAPGCHTERGSET
jgi:hypothetical protein